MDRGTRFIVRHLRFGWWSLLVFLSLGTALEALHGFKVGWYLDVSNATRRYARVHLGITWEHLKSQHPRCSIAATLICRVARHGDRTVDLGYNLGMPVHDWTKVPAGVYHHLHGTWLFELAGELNEGVLPTGYYALGEQVVSGAVPDVLTLEQRQFPPPSLGASESGQLSSEPSATLTAVADAPVYPPRPRVVAVRHVTDDRVVAVVEIVSPGNKKEAAELGAIVEKTTATLSKGIHVVVVDLFPPGSLDPDGLHNVIWRELGQGPTAFDPARPLQVVSYASGRSIRAYIEPLAVGEELPAIPLFLTLGRHVPLPLETSYRTAFARLPLHLRRQLEEGRRSVR